LMRLISEDTVARILFAQGGQQGLHLSAVALNDRDHLGMLQARHVDATDEQVGHLVTFIGRVELPIDHHLYKTVDPARDDDPFLIGLAPQYREASTIEMAKECRIHNDDVILVTVGVILPLLRRCVLPMWPESGTTT